MSANWADLHRESERLASEAQLSVAARPEHAAELYARAAELEEAALAGVDAGKVRTRGIVGVSAAALRFKSGNLDRAEELARELLGEPALPAFAVGELEGIVEDVQKARSSSASAEAREFEVQITFSQRISAPTREFAEELAVKRWRRGDHVEPAGKVAVTSFEAEPSGRRR